LDFAADFTPPERRGYIGSTLPAMLRNALASLALGTVLLGAGGCGDVFRPPVSSISPVGPATQPAHYAVVVSDPGNGQSGVFTMVDVFGDTIRNTTPIGVAPQYFILAASNTEALVLNHDGSVNSFGVSGNLLSNEVQASTLFAGADANSIFPSSSFIYFTEPYTGSGTHAPSIAEAQGLPPSVKQELTVPANPVFIAGTASSSRIYAISQGATPGTSIGQVTAIQTSGNTISNTFNVGVNPIYGVMTPDNNRAFILNQGSNSVSVINVNTNQLDASPTANPIPVGGGPVWADLYYPGSLLVTANATGNSISIISIPVCSIVALPTNPACDPTNPTDGAAFGTVLATVPVGTDPQMVTVLQDGTRAYVANLNATYVSGYSVVGDPSTITGFTVTNNVATINAVNDYVAGSYVAISGATYDGAVLNGGPYTVLPGPTSTQFQIAINTPNASNVAAINGFSTSTGTAAITGFLVSNNTAELTGSNNFIAGQSVTISGMTGTGAFLNGGPYTVLGATPTLFEVTVASANIAQTTDTGSATGTAIATITTNAPSTGNSFVVGQTVTISGMTGTGAFLNGTHVVLPGTTTTQFLVSTASSTSIAQTADAGTATGQITGTAIEGTATVTAPNSYTAGTLVELLGLRNGVGPSLNGGPYKVLPAGLTANQFEVEVPVGATALTADTGTTSVSGTFGSVSVVNLGTYTVSKTIVFDGNTTNLDGSTNVNHGPYCHPNFINSTAGTPTGKVYVTCPDGQLMTVLETDIDSVRTLINLDGYAVQMRVTSQ
jgi:YVTN family beta-propeller protein